MALGELHLERMNIYEVSIIAALKVELNHSL